MKYTKEDLMNTKVRVKSPEHSEYIQKLVFSLGGKWADGVKEPVILEEPYLFIAGDLTLTYADLDNRGYFEEHSFKEIELPLPEGNEDTSKVSSAVEAMNSLGYKYCEKEQAWYKEIKEWVK